MIPIRDANPSLTRPVITWLIIAACAYVFFAIQPAGEDEFGEFLYEYAAVPCELTTLSPLDPGDIQACNAQDVGTPFYPAKNPLASALVSMFLHANLVHLLGNLWILWIFGNNVEDAFGSGGYLLLYLASGVAATAAFVVTNPGELTPLVGASAKGRVTNSANGKSVEVDLIPISGPKSAGSRLSLAAMRSIEAPLTELPTVEVFAN